MEGSELSGFRFSDFGAEIPQFPIVSGHLLYWTRQLNTLYNQSSCITSLVVIIHTSTGTFKWLGQLPTFFSHFKLSVFRSLLLWELRQGSHDVAQCLWELKTWRLLHWDYNRCWSTSVSLYTYVVSSLLISHLPIFHLFVFPSPPISTLPSLLFPPPPHICTASLYIDRQTDWQTDRQTDRQTDKLSIMCRMYTWC